MEVSTRLIFDERTGERIGSVSAARDVSERVEGARLLRERESKLAQAERSSAMGQMAAQLAHEINQPLFAISNYAEACRSQLEQEPHLQDREVLDWATKIAVQAQRLGQIVLKVQQFTGKGEMVLTSLDLNQCLENMLLLLNFGRPVSDIPIELELTQPLPTVKADRLLIEQVLVNLVRNAQESILEAKRDKQKLVIATQLIQGATPPRVRVEVRDTGMGISSAMQEFLFEPFQTTKVQGIGMGLAICKAVIRAHQGTIEGRNNSAGGATFAFELPLEGESAKL